VILGHVQQVQILPQCVVTVVGQEALLTASEQGVDRAEAEPVSVDPVATSRRKSVDCTAENGLDDAITKLGGPGAKARG
jgi:hypothetical protein